MRSEAEPRAVRPDDGGRELVAELVGRLEARGDAPLADFARIYVRRASAARFDALDADELAAHVASLFEFVDRRPPGQIAVRAFDPAPERDGWSAGGTVVEVNMEDAPFIVDSVREELRRHGLEARLVSHPVCGVVRGEDGHVEDIVPAREGGRPESIVHVELDRRLSTEAATALAGDVRRVLGDVRRAVDDYAAMRDRVGRMREAADLGRGAFADDDVDDAVAFLQWLCRGNFIFLGYREYEVRGEGEERTVSLAPGSGLGILREAAGSRYERPLRIAELPSALRERVERRDLLTISATNRESTVHRRGRMDYVGVKRFDAAGRVEREHRLLGLLTSQAARQPAWSIPIVRRKLDWLVQSEDLVPGSHDHKAVVALVESFPKGELFALDAEELRARVMALLEMAERPGVRVFVRRSGGGRSVSVLVALPRSHVSDEVRRRLERLLLDRYGGVSIEGHLHIGDEEPARLHFTVHVPEGAQLPSGAADLEREVEAITRTWGDRFADELRARGHADGEVLARRYVALLPDYYTSAVSPRTAADDVEVLESLGPARPYEIVILNEPAEGVAEPLTRLKLYKIGGKADLSSFLPILENLGLRLVEEVPTRLHDPGGAGYYLHDIGVLGPDGELVDVEAVGDAVAETVRAVWDGRLESDSLNRLVTVAGIRPREVAILRAYRQYRGLLGAGFTDRYQNDAFARNADVARKLVALFEARFDPAGGPAADARAEVLVDELRADLDAIPSLDDDRILRGFLGMILATVRTNAWVAGGALPYLSLKLDCARVPGMPRPVPMWEIFVSSPQMAGVHLRGGPVARGGIRWSDRLEDFRTEVLGLMKAQMVKNAVIVPVGAKGGFVLKRPPADRDELMAEERRQYVTLVRGMLDVTDDIRGGRVVHPPDVRVHDAQDAYLVVAADKGTAHLSDTANAVSAEYGFWLGDAFASGGSDGYDHKELGITAKGAWESVKRHFREMGRDPMTAPFTAVGIGDMSGDVFGNGMLLSRTMRLVAAFDHRHVFVDPDPDPAAAYAERQRLFRLPRSSWADYDPAALSPGGGVFSRAAKSVDLSPQAREALGVAAETLTPNELVQAVLRAPVDLFWNGGVGTFVKASTESNADVGDRGNDAVRVDGRELRALVVAEGGNLGFTQYARIEYALAGGRINTDAIDNSAGVDSSDHEVNLKILLRSAIEAGELTFEGRNELLDAAAGDVVEHVLYDNFLQVQILSQEDAVSTARMEAYEDLMVQLEARGMLDRGLESLPSSEAMAERRRAGRALVRPELCLLLAYAKRLVRAQVLDSALPDDPFFERSVAGYFPRPVVERFGAHVGRHPLRRELAATVITNDVVNAMGITFVPRMAAETGGDADDVARAFFIASAISDARPRWGRVEQLDPSIPADVQAQLMSTIDDMVEQIARWYLKHVSHPDPAAEVERGRAAFEEMLATLDAAATGPARMAGELARQELVALGVPDDVARFSAAAPHLIHAPDVAAVARAAGRPVREVAHASFLVGERLFLDAIERRVGDLPAETRWQRLAYTTMVDDLRLLRRQIVERVIAEGGDLHIDEATERYLERRIDPYERLAALMESPAADATDDASVIMVLISQIRQVVSL